MTGGNPLPPDEEERRQAPGWERVFWLVLIAILLGLWALARPS